MINIKELDLTDSAVRQRLAVDAGWTGHTCRSCQTPVVFKKNRKSGKTMILDAVPDQARGNCYIVGVSVVVWPVETVEPQRAAGIPFHLDHHVTCPHADLWRKQK